MEKNTGGCSGDQLNALNWLIKIFGLFGVAPVLLTSDGVRTSRPLIVYSRLLIIIFNIFIIIGVMIDATSEAGHEMRLVSHVDSAVWLTNISIVMVLVIDGTYNAPWRIPFLIRMLQFVDEIQFDVADNSVQYFTQKKTHIILGCIMSTVIILLIADFQEFYWVGVDKNRELIALFCYGFFYVEYFILILLEIQFVLLTRIPYVGLHSVNVGIQKLLNDYPERVKSTKPENLSMWANFHVIRVAPAGLNIAIDKLGISKTDTILDDTQRSRRICAKLHQLSGYYIKMCSLVREINTRNGPMLLCITLMLFLDFVINSYYWTMSLLSIEYEDFALRLETFWCIFHVVNTIFVMQPFNDTQLEFQQTRTLLGLLMHRSPMDSAIKSELDKFLQHLLLNDASYSPMGMFTISASFVIAITRGMVTYLVVFVQLQLGLK